MNVKYVGRAVVLALVLALILSVPVVAREAEIAVVGRKYDSWDYYVQYQWVMEGMKPTGGRYRFVIIQPGPDSNVVYDQYQWAQQQAEAGDDADWDSPQSFGGRPLPKLLPLDFGQYQCLGIGPDGEGYPEGCMPKAVGGGKPLPSPVQFYDSSVMFDQYLWALQDMDNAIQEAVPNE